MANTKEWLEGLEVSFGMMQDDMQKISGAMVDMRRDFDDKFKKMEESFARLFEAMTANRDMGESPPSRNQRPEGQHNQLPWRTS